MEEDSCSGNCGFESTLDGHFFTYICCNNKMFVLKTKINEKEASDGQFKKNVKLR